jgi:hypothetical protein
MIPAELSFEETMKIINAAPAKPAKSVRGKKK